MKTLHAENFEFFSIFNYFPLQYFNPNLIYGKGLVSEQKINILNEQHPAKAKKWLQYSINLMQMQSFEEVSGWKFIHCDIKCSLSIIVNIYGRVGRPEIFQWENVFTAPHAFLQISTLIFQFSSCFFVILITILSLS